MQIDDSVLPGLNLLRLIDSVEENPATKRGVAIGCIRSQDGNCDESAILQLNTQNGDSVEVTKMKSSSKSEQVFASGSAVYRVDTDLNDARSLKVTLEQTSYGGTHHQSTLSIDLTSLVGADDAVKIIESQFYLVDSVPVIHFQAVVTRSGEPTVRLHFVVGGIEDGKLASIYVPHSAEEKALVAVDSIASSSRSIRQLHVYVNDVKASTNTLLDGKIRVTHGLHHIHLGDSMVGLIKESEKVIVAEGGSRIAAFDVSSSLAHVWTRHEALSRLQQAILLPGTTMKTSSSFFGALDAICAQSQFAYAKPLCALFDSSKIFLESLETAMHRILPSRGSHHRHHRGDALVSGQDHVIALSYSGNAAELLAHPRPLHELNVQVHSLVFPHDLPALSELNGGNVEKSVLISSRRLVASRRSSSSGAVLVRSLRLLQVPSSAEVDDGSVSVRIVADIVDGGVVSWVTAFSLEEDMRARNGDEYTSVISSTIPAVQTVLSSEELDVPGNVLAVMPTHIVAAAAAAENEGSSVAIVPLADKHHHKVPVKTPHFVHTISTSTGEISIFDSKTSRKVSSVQFDPTVEEIVNVAFPLSNDLIYSRVVILGDDNILVKYLNPNMVAVCTATQGREDGNATVTPQVFVNLLDIVSGNVLQRVVIDSAAAPVRAHLMENFVLVSYWNPVVKRAEIITMGLYDGVIGKTDYLPFASKPSVGTREHDEKTTSKAVGHEASSSEDDEKTILLRSSFLTSIPLVMQRTYLMPRKVMDVTHTLSRHGLTNKNILLTMESGEVYNLDFRLLHPRRPLSEPTAAEKEEGLMRYGPIFPLMPQSTVTMEQGLRPTSRYPIQTLSAPSYLESEALIFIYGCFNDVLFTSVTPSQGFDTLSANFNYTALVGLITLLFVAVMVLRRMHRRTTLKRLWQ
eukprot:gene11214-7976_t